MLIRVCMAVCLPLLATPAFADARAEANAILAADLNADVFDAAMREAIAACATDHMSDRGIAALIAAETDQDRGAVIEAEDVPDPNQLRSCAEAKVAN